MMNNTARPTILCVASFEKGHEFLRQCKRAGWRVLLLTSQSLKDNAQWPWESIDEVFYMPDVDKKWAEQDTLLAVSYLARTLWIDRIVPLEDFDLEIAAAMREHLRVPGMGETTTRYFRDKLAMRMRATVAGLRVPEFIHTLHHERIREFTEKVPGPWMLKPRFMAGAIGIKRVANATELWERLQELGDQQSFYVLERYVPGDIYHVDTLVYESEVRFVCASRYGRPPLDVAHDGDVFTTQLLERGGDDERELIAANAEVLRAMHLVRGASHTEFIRGREDGKIYFLETSARVGGAHIAELIDAATGVNMWAEWAKIELAGGDAPYASPEPRKEYAGLLISLARQPRPDTSSFVDPEIVWRMDKLHHVGFIVRSPHRERVTELLAAYLERIRNEFHAFEPPKDHPTD